ncbi:putative nucleoside diphosphate kinase 5 isoform X1 [Senna tora]|uniref:Nucleoside diphosphate kinase n=1 Tax=Senna tora TaxID=362788 RepID=A0A834T060_9FABA|nr:putative nucleoside diphosphate kinase 5 isoform X1 [Senna tora]
MRLPIVGFIRILVLFVLVSDFWSWTNGNTNKEKTLAIIKPDGLLGNHTDDIKKAILEYGFSILKEKTIQLDEDAVTRFYAEHSSKNFFSSLMKYMTSGPVVVMILEKENAIADWRALMGPTDASKAKSTHPHSIRAMCGLDIQRNCVHGSDSLTSAQREMSFFFRELSAVKLEDTWGMFGNSEGEGRGGEGKGMRG